jgi:HK97 family phage major capsid protein
MAAKINELRQKRIEAKAAFTKLLENHLKAAQADGRAFTVPEKAAQKDAERDVDEFDREILEEERRLAGEKAAAHFNPSLARDRGASFELPFQGDEGRMPGGQAVPGRRWAEIFGAPRTLAGMGFESSSEFWAALSAHVHHPGLIQAASMGEGVGSDGGFLVPEELVVEAFDGALEDEPVLRMVQVEGMTSETKRVSGFATKNHSSSGPFGFSGGWVDEGQPLTPEKATVRSIKLTAKKLALLVQASNEVAADGRGFGSQLDMAMREAMGWLLADAVFNGGGSGQPLGALNGPCTIVVAKESGQGADTIAYQNITKMLSRLLPASMNRAAWFASHTTRPELMKLSVPIGVAGSFVPLQLGADGVYRLLGVPLYWTEHVPALGDQGDLGLYDFSQYVLGIRKAITIDRSAHVGFTSDLMTYRGILRADGEPKHDAAFQPKSGTTQAPFVVLGAR